MFSPCSEPAKRVCELHLQRTAALGFQKTATVDDNHYRLSTRHCDIESIQTVKKFHSSRGILWRGGRQRVNDRRCLLTLKYPECLPARSEYGSTGRKPVHCKERARRPTAADGVAPCRRSNSHQFRTRSATRPAIHSTSSADAFRLPSCRNELETRFTQPRVLFDLRPPVPHWKEHRSSKPMVAGSIPAGCDSVNGLSKVC
jgi:hypothetical protein